MLLHYSPIPEIIFIGFIQTHKKRSHERPLSYNQNTIYYLIFSLKLLLYQSSRFLSNTSTTAATIINANLVVILFASFFYHFLSIIMWITISTAILIISGIFHLSFSLVFVFLLFTVYIIVISSYTLKRNYFFIFVPILCCKLNYFFIIFNFFVPEIVPFHRFQLLS